MKEREIMLKHKNKGFSNQQIADIFECDRGTVRRTLLRYELTGSHENYSKTGRKSVLSESDRRCIKLASIRDRFKTCPILTSEFNIEQEKPVSETTVRRVLMDNSLNGCLAASVPLLRPPNVKKRLAFALKYAHWTAEDWLKVLYTDESKFELYNNKGVVHVRRMPGERYKPHCTKKTVKHGGGSLFVWGGVSGNGVLPLKRIDVIMNKEYYHQILIRHVVPGGTMLCGKNFYYLEDNDPKHSSLLCRG